MRWRKLILYASFGWITLLLSMLVYLVLSLVIHQSPDGVILAAVAGLGWLIGALALATSDFYFDRRIGRENSERYPRRLR